MKDAVFILPHEGVPRRPACAEPPIMGRRRALPPFSSQRPREGPKVHGVSAVGTRKHPQEKTGKVAAETSTSLGISGSGKQHWFSPHFYTTLEHSTYLVRLAFPPGHPHGSTAASNRSALLLKCRGVAGQHWPPPATST